MAETALAAVEATDAILGLVELAVKVAKRVNNYVDTAKNVPKTFIEIRVQLPLITPICEKLLDRARTGNANANLIPVLQGLKEHISELDGLLDRILPEDGDRKRVRIYKAISSITNEKRLLEYQRLLESYKSILTLYHADAVMDRPADPSSQIATIGTYFHMPPTQITHFVGRRDLLKKIKEAVAAEKSTIGPRVVVLLGMGGQGKTQLALRSCRLLSTNNRFEKILWIDATSDATLAHSFESIAEQISGRARAFRDTAAACRIIIHAIEKVWKAQWLMVFDNYDDPAAHPDIRSFFPNSDNGAILITSRHGDTKRLATEVLQVTEMTEQDAVNVLLSQFSQGRHDESAESAKTIVKALGYLPLAIDQAAAYMDRQSIPVNAFVDEFEICKESVLKHIPDQWEYKRKLDGTELETSLSVFTTWELSVQQIGKDEDEKKHIIHLFTLFAFFNHGKISEAIFEAHFQATIDQRPEWMRVVESDSHWDQYQYRDVVSKLLRLSLL
ncbi:MAG: hypothetical protein Q9157_001233 [Trypethelium eluteriae]